MSSREHTRRSVLKLGAGAASMAALSGCSGLLGNDEDRTEGGQNSDTTDPLAGVPADATFVVRADVTALLGDENLRETVNSALTAQGAGVGGPQSLEAALDQAETQFGLDPRGANTVLLSLDAEAERSLAILDADWDQQAVADAIENSAGSVSTTEYSGQQVYEASDGVLGVLPDGRYAVSNTAGVEAAIDVAAGDAAGVSGDLQTAFTAAPDGHVQFAGLPPKEMSPPAGGPVSAETYDSLQYGYGTLYRDGTTDGELSLELTSADAAASVVTTISDGKEMLLQGLSGQEIPAGSATNPTEAIESVGISREDTTVVVETSEAGGLLAVLLAVAGTFVLGLGAPSRRQTPAANFSFEYADGATTVTHASGDSIRAGQLRIVGSGLGQTGLWSTLDPEHGPGEMVSPGDSLRVETRGDAVVRIVWESPGGEMSAVLAQFRGPDA